jgi:hypothetical protein
MKLKQKPGLTLGDFIMAAYQVWGAGQAEKMVQMAVMSRMVVFRERPDSFLSTAKARCA